jgi:hypothetical protein
MHPGAVLADIGHLAEIRVEPGGIGSFPEGLFVHPRGAGGHDDTVEVVLGNSLFEKVLARIGAHVFIIAGIGNAGDLLRGPGYPLNVNGSGNVFAAVADKYAYSGHLKPHLFNTETQRHGDTENFS